MTALINGLALGLPQGAELWILLGLVLLFFGGAKIPQLMRGIGKGVGELKEGLKEGQKTFKDSMNEVNSEEDSSEAKS